MLRPPKKSPAPSAKETNPDAKTKTNAATGARPNRNLILVPGAAIAAVLRRPAHLSMGLTPLQVSGAIQAGTKDR